MPRRQCWPGCWKPKTWVRKPVPAFTKNKAATSCGWTRRPWTMCRAVPSPMTWSAACSKNRPASGSNCCAKPKAPSRVFCGPFCEISCTMRRFICKASPRRRATLIWPCAGALAAGRGRLSSGRKPAGCRWRNGFRKISTPVRRCAARRCRPGCSKARWPRPVACTRRKARGARPRKPSYRAASCRCMRASIFRKMFRARRLLCPPRPAGPCTKTLPSGCGRWTMLC